MKKRRFPRPISSVYLVAMMSKKILTPKRKMYIYCEGLKTEPFYIRDYIEEFKPDIADVFEIPPTRKNTPVQLVEEAIAKKNSKSSGPDDVFWVVYDRESVAKYPSRLHHKAWGMAERNNINIAFSNICFELWILLHFVNTTSPYSCCDDLLANSPLKECLKKIGVQKYEKGCADLFSRIKHGIPLARKRAEKMNEHALGFHAKDTCRPYDSSCYVSVHELLNAIDSFKR